MHANRVSHRVPPLATPAPPADRAHRAGRRARARLRDQRRPRRAPHGTAVGHRRAVVAACAGERHSAPDRGGRPIITGKNGEYYYTPDHYETFRRVDVTR